MYVRLFNRLIRFSNPYNIIIHIKSQKVKHYKKYIYLAEGKNSANIRGNRDNKDDE